MKFKNFLVLFIFCSFCIEVLAKTTDETLPTIYWLFFDFPSTVNLSNPDRPGSLVEVYRLLKDKMPEYKHQFVEMPFSAAIQQMKTKKGSCSLMFLKNSEREEYMTFGSPVFVGTNAGAIIRKDNQKLKKYLDSENAFDLDNMLKDKSIKVGLIANRYFGKKITQSLQVRKGAGIIRKQGLNVDRELNSMLALGRIDVYIGYVIELRNKAKMGFYSIKGVEETMRPRVACEKTRFGQEIIDKTESIRSRYKLDAEFSKIFERYYSEYAEKQRP